jgi:hypothetical protein
LLCPQVCLDSFSNHSFSLSLNCILKLTNCGFQLTVATDITLPYLPNGISQTLCRVLDSIRRGFPTQIVHEGKKWVRLTSIQPRTHRWLERRHLRMCCWAAWTIVEGCCAATAVDSAATTTNSPKATEAMIILAVNNIAFM